MHSSANRHQAATAMLFPRPSTLAQLLL
jgi:hypothetical protein